MTSNTPAESDEMDLFAWQRGRGTGPVVSDGELGQLIAALGRRRWLTAARLTEATGFNDRKLRALAADSGGRIISGQKGYCLTTEATNEEIHHAASWLESQARVMTQRAISIRKFAHSLIS
jgi:hypothetical protein